MTILSRKDEHAQNPIGSFAFWRNLAVFFCIFSVAGHWMEIAYCLVMDGLFGIVDPDSLVWDDPMYPFLVYGIGATVCTLALVPLKERLLGEHQPTALTAGGFYCCTVLMCLAMELIMGLLMNQPDANGVYPLWDNSELPLNVLGQAWLVNDVLLGAAAMFYTWIVYPLCEKGMALLKPRTANIASAVVIVGFIALCIWKFAF